MEKVRLGLLDFPKEPKIPLENYLLKLVSKKDGIGCSLYLYGVEIFVKELILLMKSVGISANGPYGPNFGSRYGICYNIEIRKKSEILKFKQKIGTFHLEKSKKFDTPINEIKNKYSRFQNLEILNRGGE